MIKIDIKTPSAEDLMRAAMAEVEKGIAEKVRRTAAPHGGVTVKFERKPDGTIKAFNLQGSDAAIEAAKAALNS